MPQSARRIIYRQDLHARKGIRPLSRQRLHELIKDGVFPPPDGRSTDSPSSAPWWYESTIDRHLKKQAAAEQKRRKETAAAKVIQGDAAAD